MGGGNRRKRGGWRGRGDGDRNRVFCKVVGVEFIRGYVPRVHREKKPKGERGRKKRENPDEVKT